MSLGEVPSIFRTHQLGRVGIITEYVKVIAFAWRGRIGTAAIILEGTVFVLANLFTRMNRALTESTSGILYFQLFNQIFTSSDIGYLLLTILFGNQSHKICPT